jgi:rhamnopyranosyl-N-acetylglucosaminyl-diphospho-decaprenol beta-1,3/1,4-galactofuranosyltransferase
MSVIAVIVTHRRPVELERLLRDLADSEVPVGGCVIADHAPDGTVAALAGQFPFEIIVREDASNPGPGAGWANAARTALDRFPAAKSLWYLDDDVTIPPQALGTLLTEKEKAGAESIAPLLEDAGGQLWAFPEPEELPLRPRIREARTTAQARALLGDAPLPFCWCTGACYLVDRSAIERLGFHRTDFWLLGEDLEYSMRLSAQSRAVFTCLVSIPHLPPSAPDSSSAVRSDYVKFCSLLQNLSYLAFHSPHSRHMKSYLPGNFRRFLRSHRPRPRALRDALACFGNGALRGEPAGAASGKVLRERVRHYEF